MTKEDFEREAASLRHTLMGAARMLLGTEEDAEDATQETLIRLWGMADTLKQPVAPLAKVLLRNLCVDRLRRRKPTVRMEERVMTAAAADNGDDEMFAKVMNLVDSLQPAMQVVLRLRHIEGMTIKEISSLTGNSEANVRKILSRARMAVRKHYLNDLNNER